ncbi:MAG TPA: adenylate/guanylate cyclase domain-containing protein, partial [Actinomycetota bacterium]
MRELPTGTVTFLFTDIEGSTRLLQELGDGYATVQGEHDAILAQAFQASGGVEVRREGDAFFVVFQKPIAALEAAVAAQRSLAEYDWPHGSPLRVRMGLHTGEGALGGADYVGIDVNRAARIAAAAHGGQILLSEATRGLVEHALPGGVSLRDLGEHRLKDIAHPERLYDVAIDGLPSDFPPLRTLEARPHNLPVQLTSFIGREREIEEATRLLQRARLLTFTGPGGSGKTRLALQVAAETISDHEDGVFFVDLSAVTDPALVPSAIVGVLGVPEEPGRPLSESLEDHLRGLDLLLILDNFEQVVEAAPIVEQLLTAAPRLRVIVTSRTPLGVRGEHERPVPPFEPPDPGHLPDLPALCETEAVRLFTERALAVNPRFEVSEENAEEVAEVLVRLDGLPLAIELAATRTKLLAPDQMLERLDHRLSLLEAGGRTLPERQRTLRGAIAWSYDLLEESERTMFARLSIFAGGWTLASAEAVCDTLGLGLDPLDAMTSLVDKSLIRLAEASGGDPRFSMLETIREFGREQLEALGELDDARRRHAEHFLDLALEVEPHLMDEDQSGWLDRCDREHANIRRALRWAIEQGELARAQEAAGALWRFWHLRGHLAEGRRWFEELLAHPDGQGRTAARAKALTGAGGIAWWQADVPAARGFYEESLAIERGRGSPVRIAVAAYDMAHAAIAGDEFEDALRLLEEAL